MVFFGKTGGSIFYKFDWNFRNVNPYYVVIKNKCYSLTLISVVEDQKYENLNGKILPSFTFVLGSIHNEYEIKPGIKVSNIPLSTNGYGICYFK
jgi:hypothetical protein